MIGNIVIGISCVLVLVICTFLVLHPDYEDGLFGRIGLAMLAMGSAARLMGMLTSETGLTFNPIAFVIWIGLAIFFSRHVYRFLRWRKSGEHDWRPASK